MEIGIGTMLSTSSIPSRRIAPLNNVFLSLRCPTKTPIATFHHAHLNFKLKLKLLSHLQANSILFQCYCNNWRSIPSTKPITELGLVRAYIEKPDPVKEFASKIIGSLPILGLLSRILSDEGGIAGDRIQFAEFCSRVQKKCTPEASRAFYDFGQRHGKTGNPRFVLIWCWVAALGAGLVKSEEILLGASRLRVSFDMQYEEETFNILMDEATEKRAKSSSPFPEIPIEARAEKALEAICKCCIGSDFVEEEDARLLSTMLHAVFPSTDKAGIERTVWSRVKQSSNEEEISQEIEEVETKEPSVLQQDTKTIYR
eukprot:Gb_40882 [translate_table: standard]